MATTTTLTADDHQKLQEIVQLIDDTHWTQGAYSLMDSGKQTFCLVGMVIHVTATSPDQTHKLVEALLRTLDPSFDTEERSVGSLEEWNDERFRTKEEVRNLVLRTMTER